MSTSVRHRHDTALPATMIVRRTPAEPLRLTSRRRRDTVLARWFQAVLDPRLARGVAPESGRLHAARAADLVAPHHRRSLADSWDGLVARASEPRVAADPRVPVARRAVLGATEEIATLTSVLRDATPLSAQDVARVAALLTDGASPVYRGGVAALRAAITGVVDDLAVTRGLRRPA